MRIDKVRRGRSIILGSLVLGIFLLFSSLSPASAQNRTRKISGAGSAPNRNVAAAPAIRNKASRIKKNGDDEIIGRRIVTEQGVQRINDEIMQSELSAPRSSRPTLMPERELRKEDSEKAQDPNAQAVSQWPLQRRSIKVVGQTPQKIHTLASSFDGATLTDTGSFPPDTMGAIGPTQFIAFENGRIRSFSKTTGVADGVMNADPDVFFASVLSPGAGTFTSDPQIRYDRFTGRWYLVIIDIPAVNNNRVLIAVSNAASNGTITGSTVWTFFSFAPDPVNFCDYESLGIDVNALYIGCVMFSPSTYVGTNGYVIQKSSTLGVGPIVATGFANMAAGSGAGPAAPRGVDNYDLAATEGYFVGPDNGIFSNISFRRISNPGSLAPTISANILVSVPTTTSPNRVEHLGNTGGASGGLDSLDERFFQAMIRNGRLWTAHNFRVTSAGVASTAAESRNGVRWYEFQTLTTTPTLVQSGTVYDNAVTRAAARQYFIPSVTVTGQGHAVMGMTMAGNVGATAVYVGRLVGDTLGTMNGPPTAAAVTFGVSTGNYNPPSDSGGASGRRWGDYSFTMTDPLDDMTVWTIQQYNQASNTYAVRVAKLAAPPPAAPVANTVNVGLASVNVVIVGTAPAGEGFYDPGANLPAPARPFNHIAASVSGLNVIVNSVTFTDPTHITLNLNTTGAAGGARTLTVTNPDGQTATGTLTVLASTAAQADIAGRIIGSRGRRGLAGVLVTLKSADGTLTRRAMTNGRGYYFFGEVPTGVTYIITPGSRLYRFDPSSLVYEHRDQISTLDFSAVGPRWLVMK